MNDVIVYNHSDKTLLKIKCESVVFGICILFCFVKVSL